MNTEVEEKIRQIITNNPKEGLISMKVLPLGGSTLNGIFQVEASGRKLFCKINSANKFPQLFEKEKKGLEFIASHSSMVCPRVIAHFEINDEQVLLLEWMEKGQETAGFWKKFGSALAQMHSVTSEYFGWDEDNYMGVVPQSNSVAAEWNIFFRKNRLEPLVEMCKRRELLDATDVSRFENFYARLDDIFEPGTRPALLHGDLWNGNFMCHQNGNAVLIDPAVYFGHPAIDLGMSTLFGGFDKIFYDSYHYYSPLPVNYRDQWKAANLYPLLIHLYLFGKTYLAPIRQTLLEFK